ncbi:hypothetical protein [Ignatzschineria sp. LJL83]
MKKNILGILGVLVFISVFAYFGQNLFMPPKQGNVETEPFWIVEASPEKLSVFSISLNESNLEELLFVLGNRLSLSIFEEGDQKQLEGYIRETHVGGLTARIPFTLQTTKAQLEEILPFLSPSKKSTSKRTIYEIPEEFHSRFYGNIVESIAFIPMAVSLDESVIIGRFGENPIKLQESNKGAFHYLYPEKGVDISLDSKGEYQSIVQYVLPKDFEEKVFQPLRDNGAEEVPLLER